MEEMPQKKLKLMVGECPSCHNFTDYSLLGIQRWPELVAQRLGVPTEQEIWQCNCCKTSVMQDSIIVENMPNSA